jgi:murein DD-endopeptidase MepM/ murein hydrolase activator NlpD
VAVLALGLSAIARMVPRAEVVDPASAPLLAAVHAAPVERVETHVLERGETLTDVLARGSITGGTLAELLLGVRAHIDPRRLTTGVEVSVRRWTRNGTLRSIDLRVNADTTVRLKYDSAVWSSELLLTPIVLDTVYAGGTIHSGQNLYEAVVYGEEGSDVPIADRGSLVYRLAELYEFKLDFTREIQAGDSYRLMYEREARPDGTARSQRILIAEIVNQGQTYTAVQFAAGPNGGGYYDREGKPLASGFSRYPVQFRITSQFSLRRYHPVLGIYRAHLGTDFGAPAGSPVQVTADGTVTFTGWSGGYGNLIRVQHANGYETRYAHLSRFAKGIRPGARVKQRQTIGYVGSTGLATAAHLHYELRQRDRAINVRTARLPSAPPLAAEYRQEFVRLAESRMALLASAAQRALARRTSRTLKLAD